MKKPSESSERSRLDSVQRRELFTLIAAGAGLMLLPRGFTVAAATALDVDARLGFVRSDGTLVDARSMPGEPGLFQLKVLAASSTKPFKLDAQYAGGAKHRFWQVWRQHGGIHQSSPAALRWFAHEGAGLPITLTANRATVLLRIPAQAGTYVLVIGMDGQAAPAPRALLLRDAQADCQNAQLVFRDSATYADFPYVIFSVAPLTV